MSNQLIHQPLLALNIPVTHDGKTTLNIELMQRAILKIPNNLLYGDMDKPSDDRVYLPNQLVDADIAFYISNICIENQMVYGDITIMDTPMGEVLRSIPAEEIKYTITIALVFKNNIIADITLIKGMAINAITI